MGTFEAEVGKGSRYRFGRNWASFLNVLTPERIETAKASLRQLLEVEDLAGKQFLDVGSGSGLFSLAARQLGATVHSFDYDPDSVACARALKDRFFPGDAAWTIQEASVLDPKFLGGLGTFDVVYSWGVLHHTGDMWSALGNVVSLVKDGGILCIAIYNDQGRRSRWWRRLKRLYCANWFGKAAVITAYVPYFLVKTTLKSVYRRQNVFTEYKRSRGMSILHDMFDWLGGHPFEVASVGEIFRFFKSRGFAVTNLTTTSSNGCNQFVFRRAAVDADAGVRSAAR